MSRNSRTPRHDLFTAPERAALAFAEAVTQMPTAVTDEVFEALRPQGLCLLPPSR